MSKLKVDEIRSADRSVSDSANITLADDGSITIPNGTLSAGTIGDNVTMSNKYWRTARLNASSTISNTGTVLNTSTQTTPYFQAGTGDTTNLPYSNGNLITVVRAGIYMVNFTGNFLYSGESASRAVYASIDYGTTTSNLANVSGAYDQIANATNTDDYGSATAIWIGHCSANSYLRFFVQGFTDNIPKINGTSRYTIALIRPL